MVSVLTWITGRMALAAREETAKVSMLMDLVQHAVFPQDLVEQRD